MDLRKSVKVRLFLSTVRVLIQYACPGRDHICKVSQAAAYPVIFVNAAAAAGRSPRKLKRTWKSDALNHSFRYGTHSIAARALMALLCRTSGKRILMTGQHGLYGAASSRWLVIGRVG